MGSSPNQKVFQDSSSASGNADFAPYYTEHLSISLSANAVGSVVLSFYDRSGQLMSTTLVLEPGASYSNPVQCQKVAWSGKGAGDLLTIIGVY